MNDNDLKVVRITNISNFDFTGELGARYAGRDFFVAAGKSMLVPFTLGDHLATHLARQILLKEAPIRDSSQMDGKGSDRPLWNDQIIEELKRKIMTDVYEEQRAPVISEADRMTEKVKELNKLTALTEDGGNSDASGLTSTEGTNGEITYKDKSEVIAELQKRGTKFDARATKANLEMLLK